jgi:hypothetical protein
MNFMSLLNSLVGTILFCCPALRQRGLSTLQAEYCKGATHEYTNLSDTATNDMAEKMVDNPDELREAQSAI